MDILRQELIETQKVRSELIKWKLVLVSTLGAVGLGFMESKSTINAKALLCCIPFVCVYVDAQYASLYLRIAGIAAFLREVAPRTGVQSGLTKYEEFVAFARKETRDTYPRAGVHSVLSWLMRASSILFCGPVGLYGLYKVASCILHRDWTSTWLSSAMFLTGAGGVVFDLLVFHHVESRRRIIDEAGKKFKVSINKDVRDGL